MCEVRREFTERQQDEAAVVQLWVWNFQGARIDRLVIEQQDVEVDLARGPLLRVRSPLATYGQFNLLQAVKQLWG